MSDNESPKKTLFVEGLEVILDESVSVSQEEKLERGEALTLLLPSGAEIALRVVPLSKTAWRTYSIVLAAYSMLFPCRLRECLHRYSWTNPVLVKMHWLIWFLTPSIERIRNSQVKAVLVTYRYLKRRRAKVWMEPCESVAYVCRKSHSQSWVVNFESLNIKSGSQLQEFVVRTLMALR